MEWMSDRKASGAEDWCLPEHARPPTIGELVDRIDEALATARSAEAAAISIGAAALDAAEQARRAAEWAERASAAIAAPPTVPGSGRRNGPPTASPAGSGGSMDDFTARADRVAGRLRRLQRIPLSA